MVLALLLISGLLSASELAVTSARRSRLETLADQGKRAAAIALALSQQPGALLVTVRLGVTLLTIVNAIFAAQHFTRYLTPALEGRFGLAAPTVGSVVVVLVLLLLSLVIAELAPKRLALRDPEMLALRVAPLMHLLLVLTRPLVWALDRTTTGLLSLLGVKGERQDVVTEEDVRAMVEQATESGSLEAEESELIERVLRFTDRRVRDVMTPRVELVLLDVARPVPEVLADSLRLGHTRYPVYQGNAEEVIGLVRRDDLLAVALDSQLPLREVVRSPLFVPEGAWANDVLAQLHRRTQYEALVVDEYGDLVGMVTANDLISELIGVFGDEAEEAGMLVRRGDGSYLVDASIAMHDLREVLNLPKSEDEEFTTLAGYVLSHSGSIPNVGERLEVEGWTLEVVDLDGRRIDRVLIELPPGFVPQGEWHDASS